MANNKRTRRKRRKKQLEQKLMKQVALIAENRPRTLYKYEQYPSLTGLGMHELVEVAEKYCGQNDYGAAIFYARIGEAAWLKHKAEYAGTVEAIAQAEVFLLISKKVLELSGTVIGEEFCNRFDFNKFSLDTADDILREHSQYLVDFSYLKDRLGASYSPNWKKY